MQHGSQTVLLAKRGRTYCHAVVIDSNVDSKEFPVRAWWHPEEFGLRPMLQNGQPYPVAQALVRMLSAGHKPRHHGESEAIARLSAASS